MPHIYIVQSLTAEELEQLEELITQKKQENKSYAVMMRAQAAQQRTKEEPADQGAPRQPTLCGRVAETLWRRPAPCQEHNIETLFPFDSTLFSPT